MPGLTISYSNSFYCPPVEATWGTVTCYLSLPIPNQHGISGKISEKHEFLLLLNNNRAPFPAKGISEAKWDLDFHPYLIGTRWHLPPSSKQCQKCLSKIKISIRSRVLQYPKCQRYNKNALIMEEPGKLTPEWKRKPTDVAILPQEFKAGIIKMLQYAITNMLEQMKN